MAERADAGFKATAVEKGIRRTGAHRWEVRVYAGRDPKTGRVLHVSRSTTKGIREARRIKAELTAEVSAGQHGAASRGTFGALLDEWLEKGGKRPGQRAPLTVQQYRAKIDKAIRPALGSVPLRKLTPKGIDDFYANERAAGTSEAMLLEFHRIISAALNQAVRWDMIPSNPAQRASRPDPDNPTHNVPTPEDVRKLIDVAAASRTPILAVVITLAALTGMRRGELCGLRWSDVDLRQQTVRVRRSVYRLSTGEWDQKVPKTRQTRVITLGPVAVESLRIRREQVMRQAKTAGQPINREGFVFAPDIDGLEPLMPDTVTQQFGRLVKRTGGSWRFHDLRHFTATELLRSGHNVRTVADRLGHRDPNVTLAIYAHDTDDQALAAATSIETGLHSP